MPSHSVSPVWDDPVLRRVYFAFRSTIAPGPDAGPGALASATPMPSFEDERDQTSIYLPVKGPFHPKALSRFAADFASNKSKKYLYMTSIA